MSLLPIILGSSSLYRQSILKSMNLGEFTVRTADIDEYSIILPNTTILANRIYSDPRLLSTAVAQAKADRIIELLLAESNTNSSNPAAAAALLITSDQVVQYNNEIREKPINAQQCQDWLIEYSNTGNNIDLITSVIVSNLLTKQQYSDSITVTIRFNSSTLSQSIIDSVIADQTILYCCGAIQIEHTAIKDYIDIVSIDSTEDEIIGFPIKLVKKLLLQANIDYQSLLSSNNSDNKNVK